MGRQGDRQGDLMVTWSEMPRSPGHVFYDRLQQVLVGAGFDGFVEDTCRAYYARTMGAPSVPPGRYFRMHMVGYFEGIDSERGIEWRCSDSLSLRVFLRLETPDRVPDHSWMSKTRGRLPHEVHLRLGAGPDRRTWAGAGRAHRRGCLNPGGERGLAGNRAPRHRRGLPRDADTDGRGKRDRDTDSGGPHPPGPEADGQAAVERRVDIAD